MGKDEEQPPPLEDDAEKEEEGEQEEGQKPRGFAARLGMQVTQMGFSKDNLMLKVRMGDTKAVGRMLLDPRAISLGGVNLLDQWGMRALHYAAALGNLNMIKYLVQDQRAAPNALTEANPEADLFQMCERRTPLHFAAINSHYKVAAFLTEQLINAGVKDIYGKPARSYARDTDLKRLLLHAEQEYANLILSTDCLEEIVVAKCAFIRPPMNNEAHRVVLTYKEMQQDTKKFNIKTGNSLVPVGVPGMSAVNRVIQVMNRVGAGAEVKGGIFGIMNGSSEPKYPISAFVKFKYIPYIDTQAIWIQELFIAGRIRRDRNATVLILHTLLYAAKGPHHLKKAVAVAPKANFLAVHFFQGIGFTIEPPYRVPRKLRRPDYITFVANDIGALCGKLSRQLNAWLERKTKAATIDFTSKEHLEAEKEKEYTKQVAADWDRMQQELELLIHPPLGRMQVPMTAVKGGPFIDISNRPRDITSNAKKVNIFEQGAKKDVKESTSGNKEGKQEEEEEERFLCENDRVPPHVVEQHRAQIQRARNHSEWQNRKVFRRKGNSRVLNQPFHDVSEWMEELDRLADFQLPKGWVTQKEEDGTLSYLHIDTKERRVSRPLSARNQAVADVQHKLETGYVARIDSGGRPRSATVGVRLVLEDYKTQIPGTPALLAKYPFLELTGNKEEEEAAERQRMKQERAKFDKKFNLILDNIQAKRGNLRDFEKMAIREWGEGTPDVEKAVTKARLVLPLGPDKPKQPAARKPAHENLPEQAPGVSEKSEPGKVLDQTHPAPALKSGSSDARDASGKPKSITFDATVGDATADSIRPTSATVSAKGFGSPGFHTRRQLLRSPLRGMPIPSARQPSPVKARSLLLRDPAEWIAEEAEREQALEDADRFLAACAPPATRPEAPTCSPTSDSAQDSDDDVATRISQQGEDTCICTPRQRTASHEAPAAPPVTPPLALVRPASEQGTRATPLAHALKGQDLQARPSTSAALMAPNPATAVQEPLLRPLTAASFATTRQGDASVSGEASRPGSTASKGCVPGLGEGSWWGGSERGDSRPGSTGLGAPATSKPQSAATRPSSSAGSASSMRGTTPRGQSSRTGSCTGPVFSDSTVSRPTTAGSISFFNVEGEHAIFRSPTEDPAERRRSAEIEESKAADVSFMPSSSSENILRPVSATGVVMGALKAADEGEAQECGSDDAHT
eukprot:CAMPEP_0174922958 /NCGR_PEP_ID=MMETSP1355-20121228/6252_1 /TAXON_ID=464990 /ORGANISM="Hemiselmis tepida, Strain CCMP443" /LENGTH=1194 /DNA_ID=CAMNT_0016168605 /DNA_START=33 /DNA_END=3616 /DNA_ORIENTATION=+